MAELGGSAGMFGDAALQKAITRALSNVDTNHNTAIVAHVDQDGGASLSLVVRAGDHWKLSGTLVKEWDKPFKYGAEAVWSGNFKDLF